MSWAHYGSGRGKLQEEEKTFMTDRSFIQTLALPFSPG